MVIGTHSMDKSPFYIKQRLISPMLCEQIVESLQLRPPDVNSKDKPLPQVLQNADLEGMLFNYVEPLVPVLEEYYSQFTYKATERMQFEWYPTDCITDFKCEHSEYLRKKWVKVRDRDLSCLLFLSDYNDKPPFDNDYEVYGGKYEFPQHQFGFNPQRGTLIVYPSGPHFINKVAPIIVGDLFLVKFHFASTVPMLYDPKQFQGSYKTWFKDIA